MVCHGVCPPAWVLHGPQFLWEGSTMEHLPFPLTLALLLSLPLPQHFVPFLKYISLEVPLRLLMGSAVPWGGSAGALSGASCLAQSPACSPTTAAWLWHQCTPLNRGQSTQSFRHFSLFPSTSSRTWNIWVRPKYCSFFCDIEYTQFFLRIHYYTEWLKTKWNTLLRTKMLLKCIIEWRTVSFSFLNKKPAKLTFITFWRRKNIFPRSNWQTDLAVGFPFSFWKTLWVTCSQNIT